MKRTFALAFFLWFAALVGTLEASPIFSIDKATCPVGDVVKGLEVIKGGYECAESQGVRWIKPFDARLKLYKELNLSGDFSLEFKFYASKEGCAYVTVNLFPEKTLNEAKKGNVYALGGPTFVVLQGACDRFEAGISSKPVERNNLFEYGRKVSADTVHRVALVVKGNRASVYLNGKKVAFEPFNPSEPIKGIGIYFHNRYATDKPYSDYPAMIGDLKLFSSAVAVQTGSATKPTASVPKVSPVVKSKPVMPKAQLPAPVIKTQVSRPAGNARCIPSTGVGEASVIGGDRGSARAEALARAKWDAIEKALGVTTSVKTIVQNFSLLDEVIKNEVGGFIRDVKVLSEENYEDMVSVKVKGCVYPKEAEKALSFISRDTAFSVLIVTKKAGSVELDEMNPVSAELINILNQQGFKVYDFAGDPNIDPYQIETAIAQRRFIVLRSYMSKALSGAMVVGKVELIPSTRAGQDIGYGISSPLNVVTARLNYYLLTRDNRGVRIIASGSISAQGRALNVDDAGYKAMESLARRLGGDIMGKIERYMASKRKVVNVVVKGVRSTRQNFAIKEKLQRVPWVKSVEDMGLGKFRVEYLENTVYLANAIERIPELKLISFTPTEIEAKLM